MKNTEDIVVRFMKETKPFTYKNNNDGRLMTDLCNFYEWISKDKENLEGIDILKRIGYDNKDITSTEIWIAKEVYNLSN